MDIHQNYHELLVAVEGVAGTGQSDFRTYRAEKTYAVSAGKWYFELEVLTYGPLRVGWAKADFKPGCQLGADDCSWAFDGYRVSHI